MNLANARGRHAFAEKASRPRNERVIAGAVFRLWPTSASTRTRRAPGPAHKRGGTFPRPPPSSLALWSTVGFTLQPLCHRSADRPMTA
jgi:hypothetical protein